MRVGFQVLCSTCGTENPASRPDGATCLFFSDLSEQNKMDTKPFREIDMFDHTEADVAALRQSDESSFNLGHIAAAATNLKYRREIELLPAAERSEPREDRARHFPGRAYVGPRS